MKHIVKTQVIEMVVWGGADTFSLQHKMSGLYHREILPLLSESFDELAPEDVVIQLDTLEIDLGVITEKELTKSVWPSHFRERVVRQIRENIPVAAKQSFNGPRSFSVSRQWIYYMQHGYLPWNTVHTGEAWYDMVLEGLASDHESITKLRRLITFDRRALQRIVYLHGAGFIVHLVEVLTAHSQPGLEKVIASLCEYAVHARRLAAVGLDTVRDYFWKQILLYSATGPVAGDGESIIHTVILPLLPVTMLEELLSTLKDDESLSPFKPIIRKLVKDHVPETKKPAMSKEETIPSAPKETGKAEMETVYVANAGLVLLHPFLTALFTGLGMAGNRVFVNEEQQTQAIILLHWLATGTDEYEEHELVMPKLLCGYDLEEPIRSDLRLSIESRQAGTDLLKAVIDNWGILKNTSPDGLREGFLRRPGQLDQKVDKNRLMIETGPVDILLTHLPWGISMVKLPWMKHMLQVEWQK